MRRPWRAAHDLRVELENIMAKSVIVLIVPFIMFFASCATQEATKTKSKAQIPVSKYHQMNKEDLQKELRDLQVKYLAAEAENRERNDQYREAEREHRIASGEEKADALFRKLEKRASLEESNEAYKNVKREFEKAQDAYKSLLKTE
jgi:hypothetical protein